MLDNTGSLMRMRSFTPRLLSVQIVSKCFSLDLMNRLYLWSKIEPQIAVVGQSVLHKKWNFVAKAESDLGTEAASLAEVDQVLEREGECDGFREVDLDVLSLVFDVGVRT